MIPFFFLHFHNYKRYRKPTVNHKLTIQRHNQHWIYDTEQNNQNKIHWIYDTEQNNQNKIHWIYDTEQNTQNKIHWIYDTEQNNQNKIHWIYDTSSNNKTLNARLLARVITGCRYT